MFSLFDLGFGPDFQSQLDTLPDSSLVPARVVLEHGARYLTLTPGGEAEAVLAGRWTFASEERPAVGDCASCTVAVVGSSGVGKSTLINRLLGRQVLATGEVRERDEKGRHTTTHRELLPVPLEDGSWAMLVDIPGLRELQLWAQGA